MLSYAAVEGGCFAASASRRRVCTASTVRTFCATAKLTYPSGFVSASNGSDIAAKKACR